MPTIAFRAIRSRRAFVNYPEVRRVLESALDNVVKPHFIKAFDTITSNWEHKPEFNGRKFITPDAVKVNIFPTGKNKEIYGYVTKGTRPHTIRAKKAPVLAFVWGGPGSYAAKTGPGGSWYNGPGFVVGGRETFRKEVRHPGSKPRNLEALVAKREKPWYNKTMEAAWKRAIRAMSK